MILMISHLHIYFKCLQLIVYNLLFLVRPVQIVASEPNLSMDRDKENDGNYFEYILNTDGISLYVCIM